MHRWKHLTAAAALGLAAFNAFACYTVYDRSDRLVYQSERAPVDMSRPLHETLPAGSHMIFDTLQCPVLSSVAPGMQARSQESSSPLLTDERTARAMGLPHRQLAGGVAWVQARDAVMVPGLSVVPAPPTAVAAARDSGGTVITEWRNPPVTLVEPAREAARAMGAGPAPRR